MTDALSLDVIRERVQAHIDDELTRQREVLAELGSEVGALVDAVESLLRGGKRLRAAFCQVGYLAAGGHHADAALKAATAMEFFQAAALLHDDVMDDSDTRRGAATAHRAFALHHDRNAWGGDSDRFGLAGAVLAGDLCLVWSDEVFATCGLPAAELARARMVFDQMRTQLMGGQFLDVLVAAAGWDGLTLAQRVDQSRRVIRYKSAKYSVEQPLLIGAAAAGARADLAALSAYGLDVGEAFQLRDDLLGVFGDPDETGKPAGDDVREGKLTMLIAYALAEANPDQLRLLTAALGAADLSAQDVEATRSALLDCGAVERIEERIAALCASARAHLQSAQHLTDPGRQALDHLIDISTARAF